MSDNEDQARWRKALDNMTAEEREDFDRMVREGIAAAREGFQRWKAEKQASEYEQLPRQT